MNLSEVAKLIYPYIGENYPKGADFLVALLDSIFDEEKSKSPHPFDEISQDNANRIFNGTKPLAKKYALVFGGAFAPKKCADFLGDNISDGSYEVLEQDMIDRGIRNNDLGLLDQCVQLLATAITDIASATKNVSKKSEKVKLEELALASIQVSDDGTVTINNKAIHLFTDLEVPDSPEKDEMVYITALLCAFSDADNCEDYKEDNLPEKHQKILKRQRRNYYKAESVRRGVRDNFTPDEKMEHFEALKEDLFDGLEEAYEDSYDNGLDRLKEVLKHSSLITLNGSPLASIPGLIRNSTKKGICHMLVNDGRISWVYKDE